MFSPSPSFSTMVVNKYKLKSNIKSLNLFGMGVVLVWYQLIWLEIFFKFKRTFVISTEIINPSYYQGSKKSHVSSKLFVFARVLLIFLFRTKGMAESLPIIIYFGFMWLSINKSIFNYKGMWPSLHLLTTRQNQHRIGHRWSLQINSYIQQTNTLTYTVTINNN